MFRTSCQRVPFCCEQRDEAARLIASCNDSPVIVLHAIPEYADVRVSHPINKARVLELIVSSRMSSKHTNSPAAKSPRGSTEVARSYEFIWWMKRIKYNFSERSKIITRRPNRQSTPSVIYCRLITSPSISQVATRHENNTIVSGRGICLCKHNPRAWKNNAVNREEKREID